MRGLDHTLYVLLEMRRGGGLVCSASHIIRLYLSVGQFSGASHEFSFLHLHLHGYTMFSYVGWGAYDCLYMLVYVF